MSRLNRTCASISIASLFCTSLGAGDLVEMQHRVSELGADADVKLKLLDGSRRRGRLESVGVGSLELKGPKDRAAQRIDFTQIARLDLAKRVFRSDAGPDPVVARRVAVALGPGFHVVTRVRGGKTYRGHIKTVDSSYFTLQIDHTGETIEIPYTQIDHLEQNLSRAAKIAIVAGIAAAGVCFLIYWRIVTDPNY